MPWIARSSVTDNAGIVDFAFLQGAVAGRPIPVAVVQTDVDLHPTGRAAPSRGNWCEADEGAAARWTCRSGLAGRTSRTRVTRGTCLTFRTGWTGLARGARRTGVSRFAWLALRPRRPRLTLRTFRTGIALGTRVARGTFRTGITLRTFRTGIALVPRLACWTFRPSLAWRTRLSHRTGGSGLTSRASLARGTGGACLALFTHGTGGASIALLPLGASWTLDVLTRRPFGARLARFTLGSGHSAIAAVTFCTHLPVTKVFRAGNLIFAQLTITIGVSTVVHPDASSDADVPGGFVGHVQQR